MKQEKLAKILSVILGPQVVIPVLFASFFFKTGLSFNQLLIIIPNILGLQFIIPFLFIFIGVRSKKLSSWELIKRRERYGFLGTYIFSTFIALAVVYIFGNKLLFQLDIILFSLLTVLSIITLFWKVSFHVSAVTVTALLVNLLFNWQLPFLYLLIPIVAWSRYRLKRHTLNQLIFGFLISLTIILGFLKYFNLL